MESGLEAFWREKVGLDFIEIFCSLVRVGFFLWGAGREE